MAPQHKRFELADTFVVTFTTDNAAFDNHPHGEIARVRLAAKPVSTGSVRSTGPQIPPGR